MPLFRAPIDERYRWNVALLGAKDGSNLVYTTPEFFEQVGDAVVRVRRNGVELTIVDDYTVSESGGAGTGFDTITFVAGTPGPDAAEHLNADYTAE